MEMDSSMLTAYLVAMATAFAIFYYLTKKDEGYPPGPFAFPFIGNLPQMIVAGSMKSFMDKYMKIYGNVFTFELGGHKRVVISGYEVMRELLVKNADYSSNRSTKSMSHSLREYVNAGTPGIFWAPYPLWKTLRSFSINTLREEGMGKASMEPQIIEEIEKYIDYFIDPHLGQPIHVSGSLMRATYNLVSQLVLGQRFEYEDNVHEKMVDALHEVIQLGLKTGIIASLPFGRFFNKSLYEQEEEMKKRLIWPLMQKYINEHKESLDTENPRDITDRYLIHSMTSQGGDGGSLSDENTKIYFFHLYMAGTETTANSIKWAILYICLNPEAMKKVQAEIDQQIGPNRVVTCKDRLGMPYTDAVLHETLRKANIATFSLPHTMERDVAIDQVRIPAGADLMFNMASVLYDETVFEEPEKFKPERYLTGDIAQKKQRTIAFGIGRRACLGESLAKMEMFLFFVTLLQRYNMCIPDGETATDIPVESLSSEPRPFNVVFTAR